MKWDPYFNRIFVEQDPESISETIHIEARSEFVRCKIVAIGPMIGFDLTSQGWVIRPSIATEIERPLSIGEHVLVHKQEIKEHPTSKKLYIIGEGNIVARGHKN